MRPTGRQRHSLFFLQRRSTVYDSVGRSDLSSLERCSSNLGPQGMPCFVVLSGKLDIALPGLSGEHVFVTYGPGQFSGEVVLISGARALSRGRVAEPGEFLEVTPEALRALIAKDAELSDIFMRAFILRRVGF